MEYISINRTQWNSMLHSIIAFFRRIFRRSRSPMKNDDPSRHKYGGPHVPTHMSKTEFLLHVQHHKCPYCHRTLKANHCTKEHLIPKSYGGTNQIGNLCLVHESCNTKRGNDMTHPEFVRLIHTRLTTPWWIIET